ncbi:MAG: PHP domain-containing protein [Candidatus Riflebacteria bacterium]|nr:PHP domain-containing protein [Candidatus Riflebacteria bacterium]
MKKQPVVFADLHTHSSVSDGTLSPAMLVEKAESIGLSALGITDHDTINGIIEAKEASKGKNLKVVAGTELSCGKPGQEKSVHVLGLFVSPEESKLSRILDKQRELRHVRALKILNLLREQGFNMDELENWFKSEPNRVLGRPHLAHFLEDKGYVKNFDEAFKKYLTYGCPAYVPKDYIEYNEAIDAIHDAGGIAVIAHPGLIPNWEETWETIKDLPWDGIEVFYIEHKNKDVESFYKIAQERKIASTGSSDYHGDYGKHLDRLGQGGLSKEQFEKLLEYCAARGVNTK